MASGYPDYEGQKSGVYSIADWAVIKGVEKIFGIYSASKGWKEEGEVNYTVPAGKTLYINWVGCWIRAHTDTDYDHFFYFGCSLSEIVDATYIEKALFGGIGGGSIVLSTPAVIDAGNQLALVITNHSNLDTDMYAEAIGYEI